MSQRVLSTALMAIMKKPSREIGAVHLVPERFAGESVFADEKGAKVFVHYDGCVLFYGTVEAIDASGGSDAEVDRCGGDFFRSGWFVRVGRRAQVVIDVERVDLGLPVDSGFVGVTAVQFEEFYSFDLEGTAGVSG